jgi:hypothetical protein
VADPIQGPGHPGQPHFFYKSKQRRFDKTKYLTGFAGSTEF